MPELTNEGLEDESPSVGAGELGRDEDNLSFEPRWKRAPALFILRTTGGRSAGSAG